MRSFSSTNIQQRNIQLVHRFFLLAKSKQNCFVTIADKRNGVRALNHTYETAAAQTMFVRTTADLASLSHVTSFKYLLVQRKLELM